VIIGILSILLWLSVVPLCIGTLITAIFSIKNNTVLNKYLFGLVFYFSLFQVITVTNMLTVNNFNNVCKLFVAVTIGLSVLGMLSVFFKGLKRQKNPVVIVKRATPEKIGKQRVESIVLWLLFVAVVVFQLIQTLRLAFPDGDDAYYVGVATYGVHESQMYSKIPYTGAYTEFDTRHCLAPFSYFISFLARMSGISAAAVAHSVLPIFFILFAYGIHYLIAKELCQAKREIALFMLMVSVLLLFGNYSVYSMETFLMTRVRQGKASLGGFALLMGFYMLLLLIKRLEGKKRERLGLYVLLACNGFAAALFTTMGNFIYPIMIALGGLCVCFGKKQWKKLFPLVLCCMPSGVMAILYLLIR